jgi:hypothetical protein
MTPTQLLDQLTTQGGAIVSSSACSEIEINDAKIYGRFAVREDGAGFVRRPQGWLDLQLAREKAHPNTHGKYLHNAGVLAHADKKTL